jgi:cytosine/adenosine deaminase-related metal-dependent hydrolase
VTQLKDASEFILARWVLPIAEEARENACLAVDGDKILAVLSKEEFEKLNPDPARTKTRDLKDSIVLPGLMNLHTHLDYSNLKHLDNYSQFFIWIRNLIGNSWQWNSQQWLDSALAGAREIMLSGTSMIADASYSGAAARAVALSGLRGIVGLELFGIVEEDADKTFEQWLAKYEQFINEATPELKKALDSGLLRITIAPHTPYSVCPALIRKALEWSREKNLPLLIHISESQAECRWIAKSDADLDKFLQEAFRCELPALPWKGHGLSPVQHLANNGLLDSNILAAHVVQVDDEDIETLSRHKVSAVHCPRSNSRLRNGVSPFKKLVAAGIKMSLGTDSAASTDSLDILEEASFAWDLHRAIDPEFSLKAKDAVYYLTLGAAKALGMETEIGSLEPGKKADFAIFSLEDQPEMAKSRPHECLIYGGVKLKDLVVNGLKLVDNGYIADAG